MANSKDVSFLAIPRSSGRENFMKNVRKMKWPATAAKLATGDGMSVAESVACIRECLDRSFPSSHPETMDSLVLNAVASGKQDKLTVDPSVSAAVVSGPQDSVVTAMASRTQNHPMATDVSVEAKAASEMAKDQTGTDPPIFSTAVIGTQDGPMATDLLVSTTEESRKCDPQMTTDPSAMDAAASFSDDVNRIVSYV